MRAGNRPYVMSQMLQQLGCDHCRRAFAFAAVTTAYSRGVSANYAPSPSVVLGLRPAFVRQTRAAGLAVSTATEKYKLRLPLHSEIAFKTDFRTIIIQKQA